MQNGSYCLKSFILMPFFLFSFFLQEADIQPLYRLLQFALSFIPESVFMCAVYCTSAFGELLLFLMRYSCLATATDVNMSVNMTAYYWFSQHLIIPSGFFNTQSGRKGVMGGQFFFYILKYVQYQLLQQYQMGHDDNQKQ